MKIRIKSLEEIEEILANASDEEISDFDFVRSEMLNYAGLILDASTDIFNENEVGGVRAKGYWWHEVFFTEASNYASRSHVEADFAKGLLTGDEYFDELKKFK